jgi:hypothetical protein
VPSIGAPKAHPADCAVILDETLDGCSHRQAKTWILAGLFGQEVKELLLGDEHDVRKPRANPPEVDWYEWAMRRPHHWAIPLDMADLVEPLGQAHFVQDFEKSWMESVTPEIAVEVEMRFQ